MVLFLQDKNPLKMQQTQEQNQNKNNTQIEKSTRVNANAEKFGIKFKLIAHYQQQPMQESHKQQELKLLKMHKKYKRLNKNFYTCARPED